MIKKNYRVEPYMVIRYINLNIYRASKIKIDQILLAIPTLNSENRKRILISLSKFDLPILQIPSIDELTNGKARIDTLIPIEITELLGRKQTKYETKFIANHYFDKVVCITGAAGSIGSIMRTTFKIKIKNFSMFRYK